MRTRNEASESAEGSEGGDGGAANEEVKPERKVISRPVKKKRKF